jgi:hypothetical protein
MFKTDKIYRLVDGRSVVIKKEAYGWEFIFRDAQKHTIWSDTFDSEERIIKTLINIEQDTLTDAIDVLKRFYPNIVIPSDEVVQEGIVVSLEEYDLMDDV